MSNDPTHRILTALLGTALVGVVAVAYPVLIPALGIAVGAFMALAVLLKL
ncbi:hypothetical protein AB0957_35345 [Streptomyces zhihengii]